MESSQVNDTPNEEAVIEALTLTCETDKRGTKTYRNKEGQYHRIYGPAILEANGDEWWFKNHKNHRENGPAVIRSKGYLAWYKNGKLHREDGPAVIHPSRKEYYYINDKKLTKKEFIQWQKDNGTKPIE